MLTDAGYSTGLDAGRVAVAAQFANSLRPGGKHTIEQAG